jgi:hypothetical protein
MKTVTLGREWSMLPKRHVYKIHRYLKKLTIPNAMLVVLSFYANHWNAVVGISTVAAV